MSAHPAPRSVALPSCVPKRRETGHNGIPLCFSRLPNMIWVRDMEWESEGCIDPRHERCLIRICRLKRFEAQCLDVAKGTPAIVINSAPLQALKEGDWAYYESFLIPSESKWMWQIAWSVARRLAGAHPGRPAIIADGEWNAFEEIALSEFHRKAIAYTSPLPGGAQQ